MYNDITFESQTHAIKPALQTPIQYTPAQYKTLLQDGDSIVTLALPLSCF